MTPDPSMHDGSRGDPRPPGLPLPVTVGSILDAFARKLTELDTRSASRGGQALALGDPRDIASEIHHLSYAFLHADRWGGDGSPIAEALGAKLVAFLLARARVDELRVDAGGEAA